MLVFFLVGELNLGGQSSSQEKPNQLTITVISQTTDPLDSIDAGHKNRFKDLGRLVSMKTRDKGQVCSPRLDIMWNQAPTTQGIIRKIG